MKLGRACAIAFAVTGIGCLIFLLSLRRLEEAPPAPFSHLSYEPPPPVVTTLEMKIYREHLMSPSFRGLGPLLCSHEIAPQGELCPIHGLKLRNEMVPVIGGLFRPEITDILDFFPYGRLCAYSGHCVSGGNAYVYRCEACVEVAKEWHGCDDWEMQVKQIPIPIPEDVLNKRSSAN